MEGDLDQADDLLADAAEEGLEVGAPEAAAVALGARGMIAIGRGEWIEAEALADRAMGLIGRSRIDEYPVSASVLRWLPGSPSTAATSLAPKGPGAGSTPAAAAYPCPALLLDPDASGVAHAYRGLADAGGAWTMLREIEPLLRRQPDLGRVVAEVEELR